MKELTDKQMELLEDFTGTENPDVIVEHLRRYLATNKETPNKLKNVEFNAKYLTPDTEKVTEGVKMKSLLLDMLEEADWDIEDVLSNKSNRNLAVIELAEMEGYIKGLVESNKILVNVLKETKDTE